MPKKKHLTDADFDRKDILRARQIMAYAKDVLKNNKHETHVHACVELFKIPYMHESMRGVRSYISHVASIVRENNKTSNLVQFLKQNLVSRLEEIQPALHPEDEQHLLLSEN